MSVASAGESEPTGTPLVEVVVGPGVLVEVWRLSQKNTAGMVEVAVELEVESSFLVARTGTGTLRGVCTCR